MAYIDELRALKLGLKDPVVKVKTPIAKKSAKRKQEDKEYRKVKKELLNESDQCQAKLKGCLRIATDLHHLQKTSPVNRIKKDNLLKVCRNCHIQIEAMPVKVAAKLGLSKSKFKPVGI